MVAEELGGRSSDSLWSWDQEKAFENALAVSSDGAAGGLWEEIAAAVPGKSPEEVRRHYELLVEDVRNIESGLVDLPRYSTEAPGSLGKKAAAGGSGHAGEANRSSGKAAAASRSDHERRKGIAWSEDEHRLFLLGLEKYGKGDWRSISRNFVHTRTPTQVASHAQKYFIRLNSVNKERRRTSIHDITSSLDTAAAAAQPARGPITGQPDAQAADPEKPKPTKRPPAVPPKSGAIGDGAPTVVVAVSARNGAMKSSPMGYAVSHGSAAYL